MDKDFKNALYVPVRLRVSKILISISQLPTPGPPRRVLTGRVRFCRVSPFGMTDGASVVLTDSPFGVRGGVK